MLDKFSHTSYHEIILRGLVMIMYGLDQAWNAYFEALDPEERLALLDIPAGRDDAVGDFCRTLWRERYTDPKQPGRRVDTWLYKFVCLPGLYRQRRSLGKGAVRKEMLDRACEDIWMASRGFALAAGIEENLKLWCGVLCDELPAYDPNSRRRYSEMEKDFAHIKFL